MSSRLVRDYWKHFSSKIHTSTQLSLCFHPGFGSSAEMPYDTTLQEAVFRGLKCQSNEFSKPAKFVRLMANYLHEDYNSVFYGKAQNLGRVLCKAYDEAFEKYDVLILPTIPKKAPVFPQQNPSLKGNVVTFVNMLLYFAGLNSLERWEKFELCSYPYRQCRCVQFATLETRGNWAELTLAKTSGTVTKEKEKKGALGSLNSDVLERRTFIGSGRFALLSRDFKKNVGKSSQCLRIKTLGNTNLVASR